MHVVLLLLERTTVLRREEIFFVRHNGPLFAGQANSQSLDLSDGIGHGITYQLLINNSFGNLT